MTEFTSVELKWNFFWDVFNCVNNNNKDGFDSTKKGHGVFIFHVGDGGVWPEMVRL